MFSSKPCPSHFAYVPVKVSSSKTLYSDSQPSTLTCSNIYISERAGTNTFIYTSHTHTHAWAFDCPSTSNLHYSIPQLCVFFYDMRKWTHRHFAQRVSCCLLISSQWSGAEDGNGARLRLQRYPRCSSNENCFLFFFSFLFTDGLISPFFVFQMCDIFISLNWLNQ